MRANAPVPAATNPVAANAPRLSASHDMAVRPIFPLAGLVRVTLTILTLLTIVTAAYFGRPILLPTCFAIVLALILRPVAGAIETTGIHHGIAAALTVASVVAGILLLLALAAPAITDFADKAPRIMQQLEYKASGVKESVAAIKEATDKVEKLTDPPADPKPGAPQTVVVKQQTLFSTVATTTPAMLAQVAFAVVLAFFLLASRRSLRANFLRAAPNLQSRIRMARFIRDVGKGVARYMLATACISMAVAMLAAGALTIVGLPNAIVWGAVMGIATLIPMFGPIIAFIAVGCAALIAFPTLEQALLAPAALIVIHVCESQFVTPAVVGRQCQLNPLMVFFGVAFMAWLWGTFGAFIAVPSLILLATAVRHTPALGWLEPILTGIEPVRGIKICAVPGTRPAQAR